MCVCEQSSMGIPFKWRKREGERESERQKDKGGDQALSNQNNEWEYYGWCQIWIQLSKIKTKASCFSFT